MIVEWKYYRARGPGLCYVTASPRKEREALPNMFQQLGFLTRT